MANKRITDLTETSALTDTDFLAIDNASSTTRKVSYQNLGTAVSNSTAMTTALNNKQDKLTFDSTPTDLSTNPVYSGGVYTALSTKKNVQTAVTDPTASGDALAFIDSISQNTNGEISVTKKNVSIDSTPTDNSANAVQSGGVKSALDNKVDKDGDKVLSTEDYTTAEKTKLGALPNADTLNADLANKQDASTAVRSVNGNLPTNGEVTLNAEDIPAEGVGDETVSGNPIVISDAMASVAKSLSVDLEPVQDLHGFDHPWVGGSGKNLLPMTVDDIKTRNTSGTWSGNAYTKNGITFALITDDGGNITGISVNGTASGGNSTITLFSNASALSDGTYILTGGVSSDIGLFVYNNGNYHTSTGGAVQFTVSSPSSLYAAISVNNGTAVTNQVMYPMIRLATETDASFAPYSNICPIYPHTQAEVQRTGKNLLQVTASSSTVLGVTFTVNADGSVNANGTVTGEGNINFLLGYVRLDQQANLVLNGAPSGSSLSSYYLAALNEGLTQQIGADTGSGANIGLQQAIAVRIRMLNGATADNVLFKPMIRLASETDATFEPYHGQSAVMPFGQDVYGCHADFSGKVTVTHRAYDITGNETVAVLSASQYAYGFRLAFSCAIPSFDEVPDAYCSDFETKSRGGLVNRGEVGMALASGNTCCFIVPGIESQADFVTWFQNKYSSGNPVQVVCELLNPIELSLTPAQLTLLQGTNILTADGTINLTYLGSMASNIQAEIDEFESGLNNVIGSIAFIENQVAKTSHSIGDYVILNGIFCKVIAAISSGETLSFGTNIQPTTIGAELRAIWAQISA